MTVVFESSLTRIADFDSKPFGIERVPRAQWATGDYVLGEVIGKPTSLYQVELASGRMVKALPGDHVVGALGSRAATLEGVGSWRDMDNDHMHALTSAGLFGRFTSMSPLLPAPMSMCYRGHLVRNGAPLSMKNFAICGPPDSFDAPSILLVGTSMSAGKTTAGRLIVHELAARGLSVVGVKLTGAGRFRDILSFEDAGADAIFDFVDAGLPSTVVDESEFRAAVGPLLGQIAACNPDAVVIEAGASPLEPYNGAAAIELVEKSVHCTVLCASDPYSVVGVQRAFGLRPDLVTGPATNTSAAIDLVQKLTGVEALNLLDPASVGPLRAVLARTLEIEMPAHA